MCYISPPRGNRSEDTFPDSCIPAGPAHRPASPGAAQLFAEQLIQPRKYSAPKCHGSDLEIEIFSGQARPRARPSACLAECLAAH